MQLVTLDWVIVVLSIAVAFLPAVLLARRAGSSTAEFFTSGRAAPWWLIGVSMVATTFSTDTPNLVTNLVREHGVANNWAWWAFLLTGMATVFFYARLWRRSGVLTDLEFYEIRYAGRPAQVGGELIGGVAGLRRSYPRPRQRVQVEPQVVATVRPGRHPPLLSAGGQRIQQRLRHGVGQAGLGDDV